METNTSNIYDLSGAYGIGWTSNTNREFYFDLEDYDLIKNYCWYEHYNKKTGYSRLKAWDTSIKKAIVMSQLLGYTKHDHMNRNSLDNRKSNFRPATDAENARNRSLLSTNTSGITGVGWHKGNQTWRARIEVDGKSISLGSFANKQDAILARLCAEAKYFGEFAPQQHLFEEYDVINNLEHYHQLINPKHTSSGVEGVSFRKDTNKWRVFITVNNQRQNLGSYTNKDEAIKIRLLSEWKYWGDDAPQKHLFQQYGINTIQND